MCRSTDQKKNCFVRRVSNSGNLRPESQRCSTGRKRGGISHLSRSRVGRSGRVENIVKCGYCNPVARLSAPALSSPAQTTCAGSPVMNTAPAPLATCEVIVRRRREVGSAAPVKSQSVPIVGGTCRHTSHVAPHPPRHLLTTPQAGL